MPTTRDAKFKLVVPLDASAVDDFKPEKDLKVALIGENGKVFASEKVQLSSNGQGEATFGFTEPPPSARVVVGPADADDNDIVGLQTIGVNISSKLFREPLLKLPPVKITGFYWHHWLRWCRSYTIRGRVVCGDGSPVPGANVCAFDVDGFWWWSGYQSVGCATTDSSGSFSMTFRWCCGWWPWWWWRLRDWQLDIGLAGRIRKLIEVQPNLPIPPRPTVKPTLDVFNHLLGKPLRPKLDPTVFTGASLTTDLVKRDVPHIGLGNVLKGSLRGDFDPSQLGELREELVKVLPPAPEFERLQIWPWFPREPWFDCEPDIAFRVTQHCGGVERVIVNEPWWKTRWNINTTLDVTLQATSDACCIPDIPTVNGNCLVLSHLCGIRVNDVAGNVGAPATPIGYAHPVVLPTPLILPLPSGSVSVNNDQPWAGSIRLEGTFGATAGVDYYEFEVSPIASGPWAPVTIPSAGGFVRSYWDDVLSPPEQLASFPFTFIDGRYVIETREHYQATHSPADWGLNKHWLATNLLTLMNWNTDGQYDNGEYHLRLVGYDLVNDKLVRRTMVPLCGTETNPKPTENHVVVYLDNRTTGTTTDPTGDEPRAKVLDVQIGGITAGPCSNVTAPPGASLDIDFIAYDIDGHLSEYSLVATFGADEPPVQLLSVPGATLTGVPLSGVPAAVQVGPAYPQAISQGATQPKWSGGGLRLHIPNIRDAIKRTCCYQIELWVYKRTIVNCSQDRLHRDFSFYSLTITV